MQIIITVSIITVVTIIAVTLAYEVSAQLCLIISTIIAFFSSRNKLLVPIIRVEQLLWNLG